MKSPCGANTAWCLDLLLLVSLGVVHGCLVEAAPISLDHTGVLDRLVAWAVRPRVLVPWFIPGARNRFFVVTRGMEKHCMDEWHRICGGRTWVDAPADHPHGVASITAP